MKPTFVVSLSKSAVVFCLARAAKTVITPLLTMMLMCLATGPTRAATEIWDIARLSEESDIVCVVSFQSVEKTLLDEQPNNNLLRFPTHDGSYFLLYSSISTMRVHQVWKGDWPEQQIKLRSVDKEYWLAPAETQKPRFEAGRLYLVFAGKDEISAAKVAVVAHDGLDIQSAFPMASVAPDIVPNMPVSEKVLRQFSGSLRSNDKKVQIAALEQFWLLDYLMWDKFQPQGLLHNVDAKEWRRFILKNVAPRVLRLTESHDEETQESALGTAARLQLIQAIPRIVALSENNSSHAETMNWNLFGYRNQDAAPLLLPQLRNPKLPMRVAVVEYFEMLKDRRALPYLLELLNDPDPKVRERLPHTLWVITGLPKTYRIENAAEKQQELMNFWEKWAATHQKELKKIKARGWKTKKLS